MWNSLVMMVIDSKTAIHIVNGWVNNTSSNQNNTHRASITQTGLTYYLHLYIHICLQSKVRRGQWRGAGHRDYWITQGSSIYWAQCSPRGWGQSLPLAQYTTIHAVSPNLHYQSLTRPDVYIHFLGLTWQTTPKKYLGSISYFTHRVFLQIKISA